MLNKIRHSVQKFGMLQGGEHVVVAVSGGPDSVSLLQVLALLAPEYGLTLTAAHLNHGLRGAESDAEERLVCRLCGERGISCAVKRVNLTELRQRGRRRRSLEDLGREERYSFFSALGERVGASRIALGHHREDQAETVLMNLIRGSGLEGLKGMLPVRDGIFIRPLIEVSREEILTFLLTQGIPFSEDSSNTRDVFLRNRIRHQLIPLLQAHYNPRIVDALNRTASIVRREDDCLETTARRILDAWQIPDSMAGEGAALDISRLTGIPEALQHRVVKGLLEHLLSGSFRITSRHIGAVIDLCRGEKPAGDVHLPGQAVVRREYGRLILSRGREDTPPAETAGTGGRIPGQFCYPIEFPGCVEIKELGRIVRTAFVEKAHREAAGEGSLAVCLDFDRVQMPLTIRNRREGDRFQPSGMKGTKKLKNYFIDEKIPRRRRDSIPLLADRQSVVWIAGHRLSERVSVNKNTKHIAKIEII